MSKALIDFSNEELRASLRQTAEHVQYAYNDIQAELDRRAANRQATASLVLSVVAVVIAVAATVLTALKA